MIKLRALVAKGHKNTNAPLIFENLGYYFFLILGKLHTIIGHISGYFEGASTFLTPLKYCGGSGFISNMPIWYNGYTVN
jgi:hypothetical protein